MADALEVGDHGGQARADESGAEDGVRESAVMDLLAGRTPKRQATMFLDDEGDLANIDLLDDARRQIDGLHAISAMRAEIENVRDRAGNHLRGEGSAFVF
jgi:hypothetical protein